MQLRQREEERKEMVSTIEYLVSEVSGQNAKRNSQADVVGPVSPHARVTDEDRRRAGIEAQSSKKKS